MAELGAGGGQGDLNQQHELEVGDTQLVGQLMALCATKMHGQQQLLSSVLQMLTSVINDRVQSITLDNFSSTETSTGATEDDLAELDEVPLDMLVPALAKLVMKMKQKKSNGSNSRRASASSEAPKRADGLPKRIVRIVLPRNILTLTSC